MVLVAIEHSLDHELTALFVSIPDREYMIRRELCLEAKVSVSNQEIIVSFKNCIWFQGIWLKSSEEVNHNSLKIGFLTNQDKLFDSNLLPS